MRLNEADRQAKIAVIEKWKQSGLSQKEFYQQQNIPAHVFYYWHKFYRDQERKDSVKQDSDFIKLNPADFSTGTEMFFPSGIRIVFHQPVSSEYLQALIR